MPLRQAKHNSPSLRSWTQTQGPAPLCPQRPQDDQRTQNVSFLCPSPKRCHQCTSAHILWQSLCHLSTPEPATAGGHTALLGEDHGPSPRPAVRVAWEPLRMTDTRAPPESLNGPALAVTLTLSRWFSTHSQGGKRWTGLPGESRRRCALESSPGWDLPPLEGWRAVR